jgi:hypothetical protein
MTLIRLCLGMLCGLWCLAAMAQSPPPDEHAGHSTSAATIPVPAERWTADAPLREGMGRIQAALKELRHYEMGHMNQATALEFVTTIQDAGAYIFTHCKLKPDADAALHSMLAPLLSAAQTLKSDPHEMAAVAAMREAVSDYPRYFDDPDWSARIKAQPQ